MHAIGNHCLHGQLGTCKGAGEKLESPDAYNVRALAAEASLRQFFTDDFFVFDRGKTKDQFSVVWVSGGSVRAYGFIDGEVNQLDLEELTAELKPYHGNPETNRILRQQLDRNPKLKIVSYDPNSYTSVSGWNPAQANQ